MRHNEDRKATAQETLAAMTWSPSQVAVIAMWLAEQEEIEWHKWCEAHQHELNDDDGEEWKNR